MKKKLLTQLITDEIKKRLKGLNQIQKRLSDDLHVNSAIISAGDTSPLGGY